MCTNPLICKMNENRKLMIYGTRDSLSKNGKLKAKDGSVITLSSFKDCMLIPCGLCLECRMEHSQMWADRLALEASKYSSNYFLTLTYNDYNLPIGKKDNATLVKSDLQKFMKRLRKNYLKYSLNNDIKNNKIRYYAVGEYGDSTARPHYHIIVFNLYLNDLVFYKSSKSGNYTFDLFTSEFLSKCWKLGFVVVGKYSWLSANYVSRYCMKKLKGQSSHVYDDLGIVPEFSTMSTHPGIARDYFDKYKDDIYKDDKLYVSDIYKGSMIHPVPKYFDKLYEKTNPVEFAKIKCQRYVNQKNKSLNFKDDMKFNLVSKEINLNKKFNKEKIKL